MSYESSESASAAGGAAGGGVLARLMSSVSDRMIEEDVSAGSDPIGSAGAAMLDRVGG